MKQTEATVTEGKPVKKQTQGASRVFIYRLRILYQELLTGKKTARYLSELLEVSTKTIYRDLDYMRDMLEMDIESSNTGRTLLDGIHQCPICGAGCSGIAPKGTVDAIMRD